MIKAGVLENPKVDAALAMHVHSGTPSNLVLCGLGTSIAGCNRFRIVVKGAGCHGAMPETGVDPINIASHIYIAIQSILTREISATKSAVVTIGKFVGGDVPNVIPEEVIMEGTIRSLLVILGAEFEDEDASLEKIRENRLLTLTSPSGTNVDAKFIAPMLESTSVQNIREYLDEARNIITGIPDRENNGNGGDTGMAVLNRNGWTDIEIVSRLKEMFIKKAKKKQIEIGLSILKNLGLIDDDLNAIDIDVTIGRHTADNVSTRATVFSTLVATGELATIDCLALSGLTNRVAEMVERGQEAKKQREEDAIRMAKEAAAASGEGDGENKKNGANKTAEIEKAAAGNKKENKKENK